RWFVGYSMSSLFLKTGSRWFPLHEGNRHHKRIFRNKQLGSEGYHRLFRHNFPKAASYLHPMLAERRKRRKSGGLPYLHIHKGKNELPVWDEKNPSIGSIPFP